MSWLNGSRIRLAVRLGVVRALEDPLPSLFLLDFVASLRQHGWPESAVNKVRRQINEELTELSARRLSSAANSQGEKAPDAAEATKRAGGG